MTETKSSLEREYIIPLRREWRKVANYRRAGRAAKAIKKFIAKHMKVPDRDVSKVKLDIYLNNELWFRGRKKPPAKIKVKAEKDGDLVKVSLAEIPQVVKFRKLKNEKILAKALPSKIEKKPEKKEEAKEEKSEEQKKSEKEKERSIAELRTKEAKQEAKAQKHTISKKEPKINRMALKK